MGWRTVCDRVTLGGNPRIRSITPNQPSGFSLTKGDKLFGKPKGDPIARFNYADVSSVELLPGKITMRADLAMADGRSLVFEAKNRGPANKPNVEVLELLRERCN